MSDIETKSFTIEEREKEINKIVQQIAKDMKEVHDMSTKCRDYAELFYRTKRELEEMNKQCVEIEDRVKNSLCRAILLSGNMQSKD